MSSSSYNHQDFIKKHLIPSITNNKTCSICLNNNISNPSLIPSCLHAYCTDCILKWSEFKRECPLCKAKFTSLFVEIDVESVTYRTLHLAKDVTGPTNNVGGFRFRTRTQRRAIGISRQELNAVNRRTRPLPRQRSLGETDVLQWRASIYEQNMRAVPCPSRRPVEQDSMGRNRYKERLLQRIEPWIHRELHAVLGDPNPGVLVHLVTSLFFSSLEEGTSRPSGEKINYLERLHPFLSERTITFWHELRCFAESTLNMETYDTVVEYEDGDDMAARTAMKKQIKGIDAYSRDVNSFTSSIKGAGRIKLLKLARSLPQRVSSDLLQLSDQLDNYISDMKKDTRFKGLKDLKELLKKLVE
nr:hypothetical protein [Tanacetum cinerariifolium]